MESHAPIFTDADLMQNPIKTQALNLVLLGGGANSVFASAPFREARARLPLKIGDDGSFRFDDRCEFTKDKVLF